MYIRVGQISNPIINLDFCIVRFFLVQIPTHPHLSDFDTERPLADILCKIDVKNGFLDLNVEYIVKADLR